MSVRERRKMKRQDGVMTEQYLSVTGAARLLQIAPDTLRGHIKRGNFAEPDVLVGDVRGWSEATVVAWNRSLPDDARRKARL